MKRIKYMIFDTSIMVLYQLENGDLFTIYGESSSDWKDHIFN